MKNVDYYFFYDESFHDRKITFKNGDVNIFSKNLSDIFVGAFIGIKESQINIFENDYIKFENKYKKIFGIDIEEELKSTIIKKKNFRFGFNNLNTNAIKFYTDFFELMLKNSCIFQINLFSKIEFLVLKSLGHISYDTNIINIKLDALLYSVIKFINNYDHFKIPKCLFKQSGNLKTNDIIRKITRCLKEISKKESGIKRKKEEKRTLEQMIIILENIDLEVNQNEEINWDYDRVFKGLNLLLEEIKVNPINVEVKIDNEKNTLEAGRRMGNYKKIQMYDSKDVIGIRSCDILANFIGRLIDSIQRDLKEDHSKGIGVERKLLSAKWFILSEDQFNLVKIIGKLLKKQYYYSTYTGIYFDYSTVAFSYINYINQFKSYEEYNNIKDKYEEGNIYLLVDLRKKIDTLQ